MPQNKSISFKQMLDTIADIQESISNISESKKRVEKNLRYLYLTYGNISSSADTLISTMTTPIRPHVPHFILKTLQSTSHKERTKENQNRSRRLWSKQKDHDKLSSIEDTEVL